MNIDDFRNNLYFKIDNEIVIDLLNKIININNDMLIKTLFNDLSELYNYNEDKSSVNIVDFKYFFDYVVARDFKKSDSNEKLSKLLLQNDGIEISYNDIFNPLIKNNDYYHKLYLNVDGNNTISILKSLYNIIKKRGIDCILCIPKYMNLASGSKKQIIIKCSTQELEHVLKVLNSLESVYKNEINEPNLFLSRIGNIGYEYKNTSKKISNIIYRGLIQAIKVWSLNNQGLSPDNQESIVSIIENNNNIFSLKRVILYILEKDKYFYKRVLEYINIELEYENFNLNSPYMTTDLKAELNKIYGYKKLHVNEEDKFIENPLRVKYENVVLNSKKLDEVIYFDDNSSKLLIEILEENDVLNKIPLNALVYLNEGTCISGIDFINEFVIKSIEVFPLITIDEVIDKYTSNIEVKKSKKR